MPEESLDAHLQHGDFLADSPKDCKKAKGSMAAALVSGGDKPADGLPAGDPGGLSSTGGISPPGDSQNRKSINSAASQLLFRAAALLFAAIISIVLLAVIVTVSSDDDPGRSAYRLSLHPAGSTDAAGCQAREPFRRFLPGIKHGRSPPRSRR